MLIKSFKAPTLKEAMANVKAELGVDAVILHTNRTKKGGILGFHSKEIVEVVAAVEDEPVKPKTNVNADAILQAAAAAREERAAEAQAATFTPKNVVNQYQTAGTMMAITQAMAQNTPSQTFGEVLQSVNKQQEAEREAPLSEPIPMTEVMPAQTAVVQENIAENISAEQSAAEAAENSEAETENEPEAELEQSVSVQTEELVQTKDAEIQDLQNELEEMKALMLEMSRGKSAGEEKATLQSALKAQEVNQYIIDDMISKLTGAEILAPQDSAKAKNALEKYVKKAIRLANGITLYSDKPKIAALIGPTGVGKTTTLAKIAAKFVLEQGARVALITADTYRISAVEQLKTYSDILGLPLEIVYNPEALKQAIAKHQDKQLILIDTAGRSQYNAYQMKELSELLNVDAGIEKHLVLSATTKTSDGLALMENFAVCKPDRVILTKVDETSTHGILLNILHRRKAALSYLTNGQSVPDDIEPAGVERVAELLLR